MGAALVSGFGQTFFIGLFGAPFLDQISLTPATLGYLYGSATLISGLSMFWLGELADRLALHRAIVVGLLVLAMGCVLIFNAKNPMTLWLGFLFLRLGGQGLTGHLAVVAAARYAVFNRGRSVAMASYGFILAEAVFPLLVAVLLGLLDWRVVWLLAAGLILMVALPMLVHIATRFSDSPWPGVEDRLTDHKVDDIVLSRWSLLRQSQFLLSLPMVLASAFVITAIFLHQATLAELKQWELVEVAQAFVLFAVFQAMAAFVTGRLVDAFGSRVLLRFFLWPMVGALLALAYWPSDSSIWFVFIGLGLSAGANGVISGAIWAELFGLRQLGLIRGVYAAFMVVASAISPMLLGQYLASALPLSWVAWIGFSMGVVLPQVLVPWIKPVAEGRA